MKYIIDLPDLTDEQKTKVERESQGWSPVQINANLGHRFYVLFELIKLTAPDHVIDNQRRMVAEALYRCQLLREQIDALEEEEDEADPTNWTVEQCEDFIARQYGGSILASACMELSQDDVEGWRNEVRRHLLTAHGEDEEDLDPDE